MWTREFGYKDVAEVVEWVDAKKAALIRVEDLPERDNVVKL